MNELAMNRLLSDIVVLGVVGLLCSSSFSWDVFGVAESLNDLALKISFG